MSKNTATNRGSHLIFHWFHICFVNILGKRRLLCIGCDVVVILTTNSCDLDLFSPFYFVSIRSIKVVRKVLCFRKNTFTTVFKSNKVYLHDNEHTLHACHNGFNAYHCIPWHFSNYGFYARDPFIILFFVWSIASYFKIIMYTLLYPHALRVMIKAAEQFPFFILHNQGVIHLDNLKRKHRVLSILIHVYLTLKVFS